MSHSKKEKDNDNSQNKNEINIIDNSNNNNNNNNKKSRKERKSMKKASNNKKVVPLLKPPSKRRKFDKDGKTQNIGNVQAGIIWDNKTIEEHYLDRKLHPRMKIDEPKTPYPDGDEEDLYQDGINKVNEIKPTEELLNNVVATLNKKNDVKNQSNTKELKKRAYTNEYTEALKFYKDNSDKFEDLSGERKICLQNTLINKFHKEVRSLSKGKSYTHDIH